MSSIKAWGKGTKRKPVDTTNSESEPAPKLGKPGPVPLMELDLDKLEFSTKVEPGGRGDKFVKLTYNGGRRLEIALKTLPSWCRAPFQAGPPKTEDGQELGTAWGWVVELTMEEYDKWAAFEAHVIKNMQPMRNELLPPEAKKCGKAGMDENYFRMKYNSRLMQGDKDKGYPPGLKMFIETDPTKQMPKIQKMHLIEGDKEGDFQCTRPNKGTVNDLKRGAAVSSLILSLMRGIYGGGAGFGLKFSATSIDLLTNLQETGGPAVDYTGVTFVDLPTPEDGENIAQVGADGEGEDPASPAPSGDSEGEPANLGDDPALYPPP